MAVGVFLNIPADVAKFEFFKMFPSDEQEQLKAHHLHVQRRSVGDADDEVFDGAT